MSTPPTVYMNVPVMLEIARNFKRISTVLQGVSRNCRLIEETLENVPLSDQFVPYVKKVLQPQLEQMAQKSDELGQELDLAIEAYSRGEAPGTTRFY